MSIVNDGNILGADEDLHRGTLDGGLPFGARQEQFSLGFVRMVAAAAGCSIKSHATDYDGVDITITSSAEYERFYSPDFELQLKCTTRQDLLASDHLAWRMERKPFLKLVNPKRYNEAFLGVLVIPDDPAKLLELTEDNFTSSSRMYWEHAAKLGSIGDDAESKTVHLPRSNLFTVDALRGIMQRIGEGGGW
ncbi:uncharacterized protein DUF4365 [Saccharothrix carnea]|uniref:Uncharacterized protein DUF4365 n=1 Tax=Saccharothrix carnea TaxID=1280637 RepID=A0A2P8I490_SACCR|nr:DUF4365 domain-containing protein [Saccharothrix carnea]PSL53286.1 uncharacterized protein DUF4365 [Saccharothrix carnea]